MHLHKATLVFLLLVFIPTSAAETTCHTNLYLDSSGDGFQTVQLNSPLEEGKVYLKGSEWYFTVPKRTENVKLDSDIETELRTQETARNKTIFIELTEKTEKDAHFNVSMVFSRAATVHKDQLFLEESFLSSCPGGNSAEITIPPNFDIKNAEPSYSQEGQRLTFSPLRSATVTLSARSRHDNAELTDFETPEFKVRDIPSRYEEYVKDITTETESYTPYLDEITGLKKPEKLNVTYKSPDSNIGFADAAGRFESPNKILISSKLLSRSRLNLLETLTHEVAHSYSSKMLKSEDWWWEEGSVQHITYRTLESQGYDTTTFKPSEKEVEKSFTNCFSKEFITDWNPIKDGDKSCEDGLSYNNLGYDHSYLIIKNLSSREPELVKKIYERMKDKDVKFTSNQEELNIRPKNNQINYFASQVVGEDLTEFFRSKGVKTTNWKRSKQKLDRAKNRINSLQKNTQYEIFEEESERLDELYTKLYEGRYDGNTDFESDVSDITDSAERKMIGYNETMIRYTEVNNSISTLEEETLPDFYASSTEELENAVTYIRSSQFDKAQERINLAAEAANQTQSDIKNYREKRDELNDKLSQQNALMAPFMFKTEELLQSSEDSYSEGRIDEALDKIDRAESYRTYGFAGAIVSYLGIITALILAWRKF